MRRGRNGPRPMRKGNVPCLPSAALNGARSARIPPDRAFHFSARPDPRNSPRSSPRSSPQGSPGSPPRERLPGPKRNGPRLAGTRNRPPASPGPTDRAPGEPCERPTHARDRGCHRIVTDFSLNSHNSRSRRRNLVRPPGIEVNGARHSLGRAAAPLSRHQAASPAT